MVEQIKNGDMVEFVKGGESHGMRGQVKKIYDDHEHVRVIIIPVENMADPLMLNWRMSNVRKI